MSQREVGTHAASLAAGLRLSLRDDPDVLVVGELRDGEVREYEIHPEDFGMAMVSHRGLRVANASESRTMVLEAIGGAPGAPYEIVCLNAGVALYAADCAGSIAEGIALARTAIASGAARRKLDQFVEASNRLGNLAPGCAA